MPLIAMRDVNFSFGGPPLLEGINLLIEPGERVSLLGRNGCGKSTLLRILQGELSIDSGEITRQPRLHTAMLDQSVPQQTTGKVFDVVAQGLGPAGSMLAKYHHIAHDTPDAEDQLNKLHDDLERTDAWKKLSVIEKVISQVAVDPEAEFSELSAGLKRRVLLAKALASEPNLLILDEPTNHLDIDAIAWVEDFLTRSGTALLFVTHDRAFLKKLSTRIFEIDRGQLTSYNCGYQEYLKRKQQLLDAEQSQWDQFDKKLAEEERWIRKGIQARRVRNEGRVRSLMKMRETRSQRRTLDGRVKIEINAAKRTGQLVADAKDVSFAYNDEPPIIRNLNTTVMRGDRIGIIGPNGSGKTTLLRLLLGELNAESGNIKLGTNVQCAYFDQLHGQLDPDKTLVENIGEGSTTVTVNGKTKQVMAYLQDFMFTPYKSRALVSTLSGGERNRLQIAKVFTVPSNVLILDEPTNDLDIETLELLEEMLTEYPGTVLIVSHDRAFLNNIITSTLVLEGEGIVKEYAGGYDDWLRQRKVAQTVTQETAPAKPKRIKEKTKKLSYHQKQELEALPEKIETLELNIAVLHEKMADPTFYKQDSETITKTNTELAELDTQLATAYTKWEQLAALE